MPTGTKAPLYAPAKIGAEAEPSMLARDAHMLIWTVDVVKVGPKGNAVRFVYFGGEVSANSGRWHSCFGHRWEPGDDYSIQLSLKR